MKNWCVGFLLEKSVKCIKKVARNLVSRLDGWLGETLTEGPPRSAPRKWGDVFMHPYRKRTVDSMERAMGENSHP